MSPEDPDAMAYEEYEAVVYDLDGTLVRLVVDWARVERELEDRVADAGIDPHGYSAWELLDEAETAGIGEAVERLIADHEIQGAHRSKWLPTAAELVDLELPAAICSLNCERACEIALERHDLFSHVETIVGRDSVDGRKPAPGPLLAALEPLEVPPGRALFVGDSATDQRAAERAGIDFRYVGVEDARP